MRSSVKRLSLLLIAVLFAPLARGEYRVFLLQFKKSPPPAVPGEPPQPAPEPRYLESTLDPEQYRGIYPVAPDETVTYVSTWRCYGRTDNFKPHCKNPRAPASEDAPVPAKGLDLEPPPPALVTAPPPQKP